jgi:hypothetical protein
MSWQQRPPAILEARNSGPPRSGRAAFCRFAWRLTSLRRRQPRLLDSLGWRGSWRNTIFWTADSACLFLFWALIQNWRLSHCVSYASRLPGGRLAEARRLSGRQPRILCGHIQ